MSLKYGSDLPQKLGGGDLQHRYTDGEVPQKYGTTRFAQTEGSMIRIQHKKTDKDKFSTTMQEYKNKN